MTAQDSDPAVLLDIEGTTTPISFVHQVLFPFAGHAVASFLPQHADDPAVAAACQQILADATEPERALPGHAAVISVVRRQMAADVKATGLKALQGLIWRDGYARGELKSQVFADVPQALRRWQATGRPVAIYSSGSRLAQQLLFRYTDFGDLTPLLSAYFDTEIGPKREAESYRRIAAAWGQPPTRIIFASDVPAECAAAAQAGLHAVLLMRPGNPPLPPGQPFAVHADLSQI
jgi:enolase-phosphatase E1